MLYAMTLIQMTIYMIDNVKVIKAHICVAFGVGVGCECVRIWLYAINEIEITN